MRGLTEFEAGHVEGAEHIFVGTLTQNLKKINKKKQVVIHLSGGRSFSNLAFLYCINMALKMCGTMQVA